MGILTRVIAKMRYGWDMGNHTKSSPIYGFRDAGN